jgi:hypothetical protein
VFEINFNGIIPLGYSTSVKVSGTHSVLSFNSEPFGKLSSLKSNVAILHFIVFDSSLSSLTGGFYSESRRLHYRPLDMDQMDLHFKKAKQLTISNVFAAQDII